MEWAVLKGEGCLEFPAHQRYPEACFTQRRADAMHSLIIGKIIGNCKINMLQR
jgi:hypothetical protein